MSWLASVLKKITPGETGPYFGLDITAMDGCCIARSGDCFNSDFMENLPRPKTEGKPESLSLTDIPGHIDVLVGSDKYRFLAPKNNAAKQVKSILSTLELTPIVFKELKWLKNLSYHYHHCLVVTLMTVRMLVNFFEDKKLIKNAATCALLHDIGLSRISKSILGKVSTLNETDIDLLHKHPLYSYVLLSYYYGDSNHPSAQTAYNHHENLLGSGYPRGILLDDPVAECIRVCDKFDALISDRPFRPALDPSAAFEEIVKDFENQLISEEIFSLFEKCFKQ